jgi:hypothetical protein
VAIQETSADGVTPFFFDGNRWFDTVDSAAQWRRLVDEYLGDVDRLLGAVVQSPDVVSGGVLRFGFRRKRAGAVTLGEWASARGVDLRALARSADGEVGA